MFLSVLGVPGVWAGRMAADIVFGCARLHLLPAEPPAFGIHVFIFIILAFTKALLLNIHYAATGMLLDGWLGERQVHLPAVFSSSLRGAWAQDQGVAITAL